MTDIPGELTFSINRDLLAEIPTVSDEEVCSAMQFAFEHFKIIIEPGVAVGLAAVLGRKIGFEGKTIAVIASGDNVGIDIFCSSLKNHQLK